MEKSKKIFIIRLILFTLFACVLPFSFIAWRYNLFTKIDSMSLSGWGIIGIIIVFVFARYIMKMIKKGQPYSMTTQIINGVCKILVPLLLVYFILNSIKNNVDLFLQVMCCVIICEGVAIPIDPLPKWANDNHIEKQEEIMDKFVSKLWKGKEGEK